MRRLVGIILVALGLSLIVGLAIGTWIRTRLDAPVRLIGLVAPTLPADVGDTGPCVLDPRDREEQIG